MLTRSILIAATLIACLFGMASSAFSWFHSGGVGSCQGCHIGGHGTEDGLAYSSSSSVPLLKGSDSSSICLNCHSGPGNSHSPSVFSFDGSALTPGGDFYWMTKSFSWIGGSSPAARHGHNIVAQDFGLVPDPNKMVSPGGTYPSAQLSCISCHDPHGRSGGGTRAGAPPVSVSGSYGKQPDAGTNAGNYRLLGDQDYVVGGFSFNNPAPIARQNSILPFAESDASHVDYGSGISEWCANCHQGMLNSGGMGGGMSHHRAGDNVQLSSAVISQYNSYLRSGEFSGSAATAYLQFVPFERGFTDPNLLNPLSTQGLDSSSNVGCLTCHRAHASAFPAAGRWDFDAAKLADSHPAIGDSGATASDVSNSYYGRNIVLEFGIDQGPFCEKCHADHGGMGGGMGM